MFQFYFLNPDLESEVSMDHVGMDFYKCSWLGQIWVGFQRGQRGWTCNTSSLTPSSLLQIVMAQAVLRKRHQQKNKKQLIFLLRRVQDQPKGVSWAGLTLVGQAGIVDLKWNPGLAPCHQLVKPCLTPVGLGGSGVLMAVSLGKFLHSPACRCRF